MTCRLGSIVSHSQIVYIIRCDDCNKDLAAIPRRSTHVTLLLALIPKLHVPNCFMKQGQ